MTRRETSPAVPPSLGAREVMPLDVFDKAVAEIDFDDMMRSLSGRLDAGRQAAFTADQAASRAQIAALAKAFADDPRYRPLLEWLFDITLRRPVSVWGLGDCAREYVDRREGANSVVWQLVQAIAEGRDEQPPIREGQTP